MPAENMTITAQWKKATYIISWDMNADGVIDDHDIITTVEYGDLPALPQTEVPTKEDTAELSYIFTNNWLPDIKFADGDATYTAQYDAVGRKYTVKFLNFDGSLLQASEVEYGSMPSYNGATPMNTDSIQYDYTFVGWSPELELVTGDATYTATFTESIKKYTVIWQNWDGAVLEKDVGVDHGDIPIYNGATPIKLSTDETEYIFVGWTPQISGAVADVTYTATFAEKTRKYKITWLNEDGSVIDVTAVEYGKIPAYTAPIKPSTKEFSYTFADWTPAVFAVTGDATYTAYYIATKNKYTVVWNVDGAKISEVYEYGMIPEFKGSTEKAADGCTAYSFDGWDKKLSAVVENVEYTAKYSTATVHTSSDFVYQNNNDGTHTKKNSCCGAAVKTVECSDARKDGDHKCDSCGADNIGTHSGGSSTCKTLAICTDCGVSYGSYNASKHESKKINYVDITKTTHDEVYACCNAIKTDNVAHNYVDKNCVCGAKEPMTVVIMNGDTAWKTIELDGDTDLSVADIPEPTPSKGFVFAGWYTEDGVRVEEDTQLTDDVVLHAGYFSGDVDGDGTIEREDVEQLNRYIVGQEVMTVEDQEALDINGDGDITVLDTVLLLLHISGKLVMTP